MAFSAVMGGIGLGLSAVGGVAKMFNASKRRKEAQKRIDSFRRQQLSNKFKQMRVSRMGADLQREEMARTQAQVGDALTAGGVRGVVGGVGNMVDRSRQVNRQIGADLDRQMARREELIARDETRIESMQENRDNMELSALQAQRDAAQQDFFSGMGDIASSAFAAGSMVDDPLKGGTKNKRPKVSKVPGITRGIARGTGS